MAGVSQGCVGGMADVHSNLAAAGRVMEKKLFFFFPSRSFRSFYGGAVIAEDRTSGFQFVDQLSGTVWYWMIRSIPYCTVQYSNRVRMDRRDG
jgi:hypothetical protein